MRILYEPSNVIEAHVLQGYLMQEGIETQIDGAYLQGAVGELPAQGFVRLMVDERDYDQARAAIERWEATYIPDDSSPASPQPPSSQPPARGLVAALIGVLVGVMGSYAYFRSPVVTDDVDLDRNGVVDERWISAPGGALLRRTLDRNRDGRMDEVSHFDQRGGIEIIESDDNFDGVFETRYRFQNGNVVSGEADTDGDTFPDLKFYFRHGVMESAEYINPDTGWPVRVEYFHLGRIVKAEADTDNDGKLDQRYTYSKTAAIVRTETIHHP